MRKEPAMKHCREEDDEQMREADEEGQDEAQVGGQTCGGLGEERGTWKQPTMEAEETVK